MPSENSFVLHDENKTKVLISEECKCAFTKLVYHLHVLPALSHSTLLSSALTKLVLCKLSFALNHFGRDMFVLGSDVYANSLIAGATVL